MIWIKNLIYAFSLALNNMLRIFNTLRFSTVKAPIELIKKLREDTSAPIGQCKVALEQNDNNYVEALKWLKLKGLASAEKRQNKQTRQGAIGAMVSACRSKVVLVEANCETDFVAKAELFCNFVHGIMVRSIEKEYLLDYQGEQDGPGIQAFLEDCEPLSLFPEDPVSNLNEQAKLVISRLQENIRIRRIITLHSDQYKYGIYVHRPYQESVGLQAGIVEMKLNEDIEEESEEMEVFGEFVDDIAAQIVGSPPKYLREDQIPEDIIKEQKEKVKVEMAERLSKAPEHTHDRIISGKLHSSFYAENLLPKMNFILSNDGISVEQYWKDLEAQLQRKVEIQQSIIWECK